MNKQKRKLALQELTLRDELNDEKERIEAEQQGIDLYAEIQAAEAVSRLF